MAPVAIPSFGPFDRGNAGFESKNSPTTTLNAVEKFLSCAQAVSFDSSPGDQRTQSKALLVPATSGTANSCPRIVA